MKIIGWILLIIVTLLQYRLWFGKYSVAEYRQVNQQVESQRQQNAKLAQRNQLIKADIEDLSAGLEAVEERARNELGLIRDGETFYRILPPEQ